MLLTGYLTYVDCQTFFAHDDDSNCIISYCFQNVDKLRQRINEEWTDAW